MTLFIACLLIWHFNLAWWWYLIAWAIWGLNMALIADRQRDLEKHMDRNLYDLRDRIQSLEGQLAVISNDLRNK